jgi:hypothetical protein
LPSLGGFGVQVRRRGRFRDVKAPALTRESAKRLGSYLVDVKSLGASFRILPKAGRGVSLPGLPAFRAERFRKPVSGQKGLGSLSRVQSCQQARLLKRQSLGLVQGKKFWEYRKPERQRGLSWRFRGRKKDGGGKRMNEKGQGVVETVLSIPVAVIALLVSIIILSPISQTLFDTLDTVNAAVVSNIPLMRLMIGIIPLILVAMTLMKIVQQFRERQPYYPPQDFI